MLRNNEKLIRTFPKNLGTKRPKSLFLFGLDNRTDSGQGMLNHDFPHKQHYIRVFYFRIRIIHPKLHAVFAVLNGIIIDSFELLFVLIEPNQLIRKQICVAFGLWLGVIGCTGIGE